MNRIELEQIWFSADSNHQITGMSTSDLCTSFEKQWKDTDRVVDYAMIPVSLIFISSCFIWNKYFWI